MARERRPNGDPLADPPAGTSRSSWQAAVWVRLREVEESVGQAIAAKGWQFESRGEQWRVKPGSGRSENSTMPARADGSGNTTKTGSAVAPEGERAPEGEPVREGGPAPEGGRAPEGEPVREGGPAPEGEAAQHEGIGPGGAEPGGVTGSPQVGEHPSPEEADVVVEAIGKYVHAAKNNLSTAARWSRPRGKFTGQMLMTSYIKLHAAEKLQILVLTSDQLAAMLPSIRARASAYLPASDPRRVALEGIPDPTAPSHQVLAAMQQQIVSTVAHAVKSPRHNAAPVGPAMSASLSDMLGRHQRIAAEAFGAACVAEDRQQTQVRLFRGMLFGTFLSLLVPIAAVYVVAVRHANLLPMCLHASSKLVFCASGGHMPSGADMPLVLGLGAIGAALAVAKTLAGLNPAGVHYSHSLSVVQGLLKVALGAITAMLGILLLQTQDLPGVLASQAGVLVAAVVFGYAQQLFTGFIDQRATSLMRAASPTTPPGGSGAASGA